MTNASNIIDAHNYYSACTGDELVDAVRLALNIKRADNSSAEDLWHADLAIRTIQGIVVRRGGFDL